MVWTVFPNSLGKGAWTHSAQKRHFPQSHAPKPCSEQQLLPLVDLKGKSNRSTPRLEKSNSIQAATALSETNQCTRVGNINRRIKNYLPKICVALDKCKCNMDPLTAAAHHIFTSRAEGTLQLITFSHTQKVPLKVNEWFCLEGSVWFGTLNEEKPRMLKQ